MTRALTRIQEFLKLEASAGLVLMAMAILAMIFANTNLASVYSGILDTNVRIGIASFEISKPALLWINDGLMAIFFFLVGLEIKREVLAGELSSFDKAALPIIAAWFGLLFYQLRISGNPCWLGYSNGNRYCFRARNFGSGRQPCAFGAESFPSGRGHH